ncbi:MAG TPA: hypothetical protein VFU73_03440 [Actinocrinis sp.]|nr:hypothetical protein [Actinocrinis sp.]
MVASLEQVVAAGLADPAVAAVVAAGDWYLVGSRALGLSDGLSDWDTLVFVDAARASAGLSRAHLDRVFGVARAEMGWPPDLAGHIRWRGVAGVDVEVVDPRARERRERDGLAQWAHEMHHAVPLRASTGIGERYRARIAARFAEAAGDLAEQAYRAFRLARNQAVASLARSDGATQALTGAQCVCEAARFWLLADAQPHPSDKWLLAALAASPGTESLVDAMRGAIDASCDPAARFDALWRLWRLVDERAFGSAIDPALLGGSPFAAARRP